MAMLGLVAVLGSILLSVLAGFWLGRGRFAIARGVLGAAATFTLVRLGLYPISVSILEGQMYFGFGHLISCLAAGFVLGGLVAFWRYVLAVVLMSSTWLAPMHVLDVGGFEGATLIIALIYAVLATALGLLCIVGPNVGEYARLQHRLRWATESMCSVCGYDLTGNMSGVCPECGEAVLDGGQCAPPVKRPDAPARP